MTTREDRPSLVDDLRWVEDQYTYATPEAFERGRGEPWLAPGTRNHRMIPGEGIRRERWQDGAIDVTDDKAEGVGALVVGRRIVGFHREPSSGSEWTDGENSVTLTLDDGSELTFEGWGYDASGLSTRYDPTPGARS